MINRTLQSYKINVIKLVNAYDEATALLYIEKAWDQGVIGDYVRLALLGFLKRLIKQEVGV
ncbi:hypothetical protein LCGC14_1716240 [marine sediment metagenome]|uniref:Uncharacterized protein n=1 Tax=marine sediment metagenome TaxID=412755 RepID=A0A0F9JU64_9ZZZZ